MRMMLCKRFSYALCLTLLGALAVIAYTATVHAGPDIRTVQLRDDCDPTTFNAAVGPGTCIGGGDTTFGDFIAEFMATGSVDKWHFDPDNSEADRGVQPRNRGGETHSFTEVDHFGNGFVLPLNRPGEEPLLECAARDANGKTIPSGDGITLVPAVKAIDSFVPASPTGSSFGKTAFLTKGTHRFQCCIHPWMQTTITVR